MLQDASQNDETLITHLDRLESSVARKDSELAQLRTESTLKDLLIRELQSSLGAQEAALGKLARRLEELERLLLGARTGI